MQSVLIQAKSWVICESILVQAKQWVIRAISFNAGKTLLDVCNLFQHKVQGSGCNHRSVSTQAKCRAMCAVIYLFQHGQNAGQCVKSPICFNTKYRVTFAITYLFQHRQSAGQCVQSPLYFNTGKMQVNVCNHRSVSKQTKCRMTFAIT